MENLPTELIVQGDDRLQGSSVPSQYQDIWIGRVVGDFVVEETLGFGGMGTVYRARQTSLGRFVALKFLNSGRSLSPESILRFEAEARTAARLNHPNIVHIYALGASDEVPYIAMELVSGRNLGEILTDRMKQSLGPLPVQECLGIMKQASMGLQAASELGLVHRDIKPENLMVTEKGLVKVADFGLARSVQAESARMTQTGYTLGTPMYMSPEQVQGMAVDCRSDIYSLGLTFYHLVTGRPPLGADAAYALAMKQLHERPASASLVRPDCPLWISDLIDWMIEKRVELRPQGVEQILEVIHRHELGLSIQIFRGAASQVPGDPYSGVLRDPLTVQFPALGPSGSRSRRGWLAWGLMTVLGWLLALVVGRAQARRAEYQADKNRSTWPAGLGMADWSRVPQQQGADWQYRYAQIRADEADQLAAWLAVPGYFPNDEDWAWRAYVQLTSDLVRHTDRFRLVWLRDSLSRAGRGLQFEVLAQVADAALEGMEGNEISLLENLHPLVKETMDPNLAELILAILVHYRSKIPRDQAIPVRLDKLQTQILEILRIDPKSPYGNFPLNPPAK